MPSRTLWSPQVFQRDRRALSNMRAMSPLQALWDAPLSGSSSTTRNLIATDSSTFSEATNNSSVVYRSRDDRDRGLVHRTGKLVRTFRPAGCYTFVLLGGGSLIIARIVANQVIPGARLPFSPTIAIALVSSALVSATMVLFPPYLDARFLTNGLRCWAIGCSCSVLTVLFSCHDLTPARSGNLLPLLRREYLAVWHLGSGLTSVLLGFSMGAEAERAR